MRKSLLFICLFVTMMMQGCNLNRPDDRGPRQILDFNVDWKFSPSDDPGYVRAGYDDSGWRILDLPHDRSIEGDFSKDHPATAGGGALPGGTGWYRQTFPTQTEWKGKKVFIEIDGIYRNSDVWINGTSPGSLEAVDNGLQTSLEIEVKPIKQ